ncbi:hypothetical protein [Nocardia salmonicida]|uniref:hypothetical protein n=1 Tax=Nocardia salmonicida TaxID=53431 RepID=UPI002E2B18DD|nr:hypothetical protein [Nocardia salmonicida]
MSTADEQRAAMIAEHVLICRDIGRVMGPKAVAGDPRAVEIVHQAAEHVRRLGFTQTDHRG